MEVYWVKEVNKAINPDGTEVRLVEELTEDEKFICYRVVAGKQGTRHYLSRPINSLIRAEMNFYGKCEDGAIIRK